MSRNTFDLKKKANKYNLKVEFESGHKWDLDILAIDVSWVNCHLDKDAAIKSLSINLLEKEYELVHDTFGSRSLKSNI